MKRCVGKAVCACLVVFISPITKADIISNLQGVTCPEQWNNHKTTIGVVNNGVDVWVHESSNEQDRAQTLSYMKSNFVVDTLDISPVTSDDLTDDALTVASECLKYRSLGVSNANSTGNEASSLADWAIPVLFN